MVRKCKATNEVMRGRPPTRRMQREEFFVLWFEIMFSFCE